MSDSHAVYDGQKLVGKIELNRGAGFAAFDLAGKKIWLFKTRTEAVRAVLNASRDTEAALLDAIEALKIGGGL